MKRTLITSLKIAAAVATLSACSTKDDNNSELASNYPPDYAWGEKCAYDESFTVCRTQSSNSVYLTVTYRGILKNNDGLNLYVRYNGKDGVFSGFTKGSDGSQRLRVANGLYNCRAVYGPTGFLNYDCMKPTYDMQNLLYYSRNQTGGMNASDIELAVVDGAGNWDSKFGANYKYYLNTSY